MKKLLLITISFLSIILNVSAKQSYKTTPIFLERGVIWGFDFLSKDELLITFRSGKLIYFNQKTKERKELKTPKGLISKGQGGLLDIAIHNKEVFITYSMSDGDKATTALAKAKFLNKELKEMKTIFKAKIETDNSRHFGSRLIFKDNLIYMTIGDRGLRDYAQKLTHHNGKIIRLTLEGKAAKGNPFLKTKNALAEIFSYGHRNPQGIDIDPVTNEIYSCEFGPRGGDELNLIHKKKNYGWPIITYGSEYWGPKIGTTHKVGMEQPIVHWTPSISPSGMVFYTGDKIPEWKNNLFLASLGSRHLRRIELKNEKVITQEELFNDLKERIRHVRNGPSGHLYFSTDSGKIIQVSKK
jgi:glucose/arabinose dehydrogenase